jgi:hypothetical protein
VASSSRSHVRRSSCRAHLPTGLLRTVRRGPPSPAAIVTRSVQGEERSPARVGTDLAGHRGYSSPSASDASPAAASASTSTLASASASTSTLAAPTSADESSDGLSLMSSIYACAPMLGCRAGDVRPVGIGAPRSGLSVIRAYLRPGRVQRRLSRRTTAGRRGSYRLRPVLPARAQTLPGKIIRQDRARAQQGSAPDSALRTVRPGCPGINRRVRSTLIWALSGSP